MQRMMKKLSCCCGEMRARNLFCSRDSQCHREGEIYKQYKQQKVSRQTHQWKFKKKVVKRTRIHLSCPQVQSGALRHDVMAWMWTVDMLGSAPCLTQALASKLSAQCPQAPSDHQVHGALWVRPDPKNNGINLLAFLVDHTFPQLKSCPLLGIHCNTSFSDRPIRFRVFIIQTDSNMPGCA